VTGAPQLNNFILVDYASLGTAANDPLRRALDLAANDANNLTATPDRHHRHRRRRVSTPTTVTPSTATPTPRTTIRPGASTCSCI
jgi:hypothetical protein